jgi:hypothetical protein
LYTYYELDNAQRNIITAAAKFANSYCAWVRGGVCLEVTKLPYNESYDTFNNISLFTGNSFKQNRVALANHLHHLGHILAISFLGIIFQATTRDRGSMDSNSLAKGRVWGWMGLA